MRKIRIPLAMLLLGFMLLFSACGGGSKVKVTDYLKAIGPDFTQSKDDLGVFGKDIGDDVQSLTNALAEVRKSKNDFTARMENAKKQPVPSSPKGIEDFHKALLQYYTDATKIMDEYDQILTYAIDLYKSIEPMEGLMNANLGNASSMNEVISIIKSFKTSIDKSVNLAGKCNPPSYITDSHNNYVNVLKSFSGATTDFVYAMQLTDPLRINAAAYRYELLSNRITTIGDEMGRDIDAEQTKMTELGKKLEQDQSNLYNQLTAWQQQYKVTN